ncbi:MAG: hypothetical protein U0M48_01335 [Xylanibacter rarus]
MKKFVITLLIGLFNCINLNSQCLIEGESCTLLHFEMKIIDPQSGIDRDKSRTMHYFPMVEQHGNDLYFINDMFVCDLILLDENGEIVYSVNLNEDKVSLPCSITGIYELQIIIDDICYFCKINL